MNKVSEITISEAIFIEFFNPETAEFYGDRTLEKFDSIEEAKSWLEEHKDTIHQTHGTVYDYSLCLWDVLMAYEDYL